jgi:Mg-chelatase subunit ChlD
MKRHPTSLAATIMAGSLFACCASLAWANPAPLAPATNSAPNSTTNPAPLVPPPNAHALKPTKAANIVELVFVLDTTGSMGGLLEGAKTKIWGIVNGIMQSQGAQHNMQVRVALVGYRDRGDAYVTKVTPLTDNLDDVYAQLMSFRAQGGGDTPEDVRTAMLHGLEKVEWSQPAANISQILFLVGDAPPHDDYSEIQDTVTSSKKARQRGIIINTIQCGTMQETVAPWRNIAQYGGGEYFAIEQNGGVTAIATPYDTELSQLGEKIGHTYLAYGKSDSRRAKQKKQVEMESRVVSAAPAPAAADRAVNKALNSNAYDDADLVQQVAKGSASLAKIDEADLPDALASLKPEERQAKLDQTIAERKTLQARILELSKQRDEFLAKQSRSAAAKTGFDASVTQALARQIKLPK